MVLMLEQFLYLSKWFDRLWWCECLWW